MKATLILLIAWHMVFGQSPPQPQPESQRQSRQWLRVGLKVDSQLTTTTQNQIRDLFTRQLRKLGDVQVVPLLIDHYPLDSNEVHDVKLRVLVSGSGIQELFEQLNSALRRSSPKATAPQYAIAVIATHPADKGRETKANGYMRDRPMFDLDRQLFAAAWVIVAGEKDLETACANLIDHFDHEVLEADRKKIRFPDGPPAPTATVPPALFHEVKPEPPGGPKINNDFTAPPTLIYKVEPEYSEEARKAKYQGTVVLYVEVDPTGHVVNPRVVRSLGLGLDEKAIEAVRKWQFKPALRDGRPVPFDTQIEISFSFRRK